jgi:hypothetical protein
LPSKYRSIWLSRLNTDAVRHGGGDDVSTITEYVNRRLDTLSGQIAGLTASSTSTSTGYSNDQRRQGNERNSREQLLETARHRAPNSYKHLNDGRGKKFNK